MKTRIYIKKHEIYPCFFSVSLKKNGYLVAIVESAVLFL